MTDCPKGEIRDLLPDLLHARLDGASQTTVEAHVAGCAGCRAELALLRSLRGAMARRPAVDVHGIVAALPVHRAPARRRWGGWRAAAAVAAIALGGTSLAIATREQEVPRTAVAQDTAPAGSPGIGRPVLRMAQGGPGAASGTTSRARELPFADAVADLSDSELSALLAEIETLDVLPALDVEGSTLVPASALPSSGGAS
jgi:hypothetical protein